MNNRVFRFFAKGIGWLAAGVYGYIVYWLLFVRHRGGWGYIQDEYRDRIRFSFEYPYANIRPFRTIKMYVYHSDHFNATTLSEMLYGNLMLFLPFGIIAPLLVPGLRTFPFFFAVLFFLLLGIELTQKVTLTGTFDVDDIILNMAGGLAGFIIAGIFLRFIKR